MPKILHISQINFNEDLEPSKESAFKSGSATTMNRTQPERNCYRKEHGFLAVCYRKRHRSARQSERSRVVHYKNAALYEVALRQISAVHLRTSRNL